MDDPAAVPTGGLYTAEQIRGSVLARYERVGHVLLGHHAEIKERVRAFIAASIPPSAADQVGKTG